VRVLFISPHFPGEMQHFTRGLKEVGAEVYAIADVPGGQLPWHIRQMLSGYLEVPLRDEEATVRMVAEWLGGLRMDRIECMWEPFVLLAARLREHFGVPGLPYDTVLGFRDKDIMKQRVAAAGIRCPRCIRVRTKEEIIAACEEIGYPVCLKPIDGAGSADTYRIGSAADVERIHPRFTHVKEAVVEEFIEGEEFTFDAITLGGVPVFHSVNQYFPVMLEARSNEWISPADFTYRDPDIPRLAPGVAMGREVLKALGMGDGFIHMEWFLTKKGEAVFGEIACRAGGSHIVDLLNWANDMDAFREWARVACWGTFEGIPQRKYFVSAVFKRAHGTGHIQRYEGLDRVRQRCGGSIVMEELMPIGSPRRDWLQTLRSDGVIAIRHPDASEVLAMMEFIQTQFHIHAG
jgi:hypothetical protein